MAEAQLVAGEFVRAKNRAERRSQRLLERAVDRDVVNMYVLEDYGANMAFSRPMELLESVV